MGIFRNAYLRWKSLRFPWRKDVFAGADLEGNLYFERIGRSTYRSRRHVIYREDFAISEFSDKKIPVQWQAWMRHTRDEPPTIADLIQDIQRQKRIAANVQKLAENEARVAGSIESKAAAAQTQQPQFQKSAPGESYQPENWEPEPATASGGKAKGGRGRHGSP